MMVLRRDRLPGVMPIAIGIVAVLCAAFGVLYNIKYVSFALEGRI